MKQYIAIALCLLLFISIAQADGPPVKKDGTITTEHVVLKISSSQIKQVEKTHIINLTADQHSVLRKYYKNMPKKFVVVTPHYNECTCDLIYLIWNKTDTIVFPLDSVDYFKELLDDKKNPFDYQELLTNWGKHKIIIDTNGNIYFNGKSLNITRLENLFRNISKDKNDFSRWIAISLPPYLRTKYEIKVDSAVKRIEKVAAKYKVRTDICE